MILLYININIFEYMIIRRNRDIDKNIENEIKRREIISFIQDNYILGRCKNTDILNIDFTEPLPIVNSLDPTILDISFIGQGESLTGELFRWGHINGSFTCTYRNITTLEGAPKEVGRDFDCSRCKKLKSLEYSPKKIGGRFDISLCIKLNTIQSDTEEANILICSSLDKLNNLKGLPKQLCGLCVSYSHLKNLEGLVKLKFLYLYNCEYLTNFDALFKNPPATTNMDKITLDNFNKYASKEKYDEFTKGSILDPPLIGIYKIIQ